MRIAAAVAEEEGVELYWIKTQSAPGYQRLQVLIDKEGGVSVRDCERVSRALEPQFDERINRSYELEVSSPGMDRQLFTPDHYRKAIAKPVQIKTSLPIEGQKVFAGVLVSVDDRSISLRTPKGQMEISFEQIASAHVTPDFDLS